ncbi:peptidase [Candidatus Gottesmanbacteria bacterium RBG_16_37_8]|uniref:Peptidase n=1 Tax=Candidatus Gottesmanbacteria bacterium RBG_16_37_8 TaxID=1798371 RepID=A0A1F5YTS4_9BACT|nr:MAG: peptidase [Candidatus Gottesmanbacteria bacterium RBG_16_37_8]
MTIASLREDSVNWGMGSDIKIEETLTPGSNYNRYLASYQSEGLKIYALLTIPEGSVPKSGWPVIVFNHGYIPPIEYRTTERYVPYVDGFAKQGYIIFKPDYRGHGSSEGNAAGGYGSNAYTIDVLNAVSSIKKYAPSDADRIGMWGHSMGGYITLRNMVVRKDIKAAVIWAGVVASYPDLLGRWRRGSTVPSPSLTGAARRWRQTLIDKYGTPEQNPDFWNSISANYYLNDISGPLQLHHGIADSSVPVEFSEKLNEQMKNAGKTVELFTYPGDNHNLSLYFSSAMQRSVAFFDKYLKNSVN